jgi:hypothetical protein
VSLWKAASHAISTRLSFLTNGIKTLEEKNRELAELLERAYGVIAQT